jgi:hypothetical protein
VQHGLELLSRLGGVVWFKLDAGTDEGIQRTNSVTTRLERHLGRLSTAARLCPTWVQSCWFRRDGVDPDPTEVDGFVDAMRRTLERGVPVRGVHLYTLARPSLQPEASRLAAVNLEWLVALRNRLQSLGLQATTSA